MAHELELNQDGTARMFSVNETPWHKLGTIVTEAPTAAEAIKLAGLDWKVEKRKTYFAKGQYPELSYEVVKGEYAVVRDSDEKQVGVAGEGWEPLQNSEAFSFFDPFIESGDATFETAGSLQEGRRIWVMAKINSDPIEVVKGDIIEKFLLLSNQHKAGFSVKSALTPIRVVCANTEAMAIKNAETIFKTTHSKKIKDRLAFVQEKLIAMDGAFKKTAECYKRLSKVKCSDETLKRYANLVFDYQEIEVGRQKAFQEKQHETIQRLFETGRGSDIKGVRGTMWGAYNSITEYIQHEQGNKNTDDEKRLLNSWFKDGMKLNIKAFDYAMELASH